MASALSSCLTTSAHMEKRGISFRIAFSSAPSIKAFASSALPNTQLTHTFATAPVLRLMAIDTVAPWLDRAIVPLLVLNVFMVIFYKELSVFGMGW
ncbi:hypothetical protein AL552_08460 (plasmid) [Vibrio diabolicus]|nr:hypothetical protein AL552_08460 [Vibrio diabolicus]